MACIEQSGATGSIPKGGSAPPGPIPGMDGSAAVRARQMMSSPCGGAVLDASASRLNPQPGRAATMAAPLAPFALAVGTDAIGARLGAVASTAAGSVAGGIVFAVIPTPLGGLGDIELSPNIRARMNLDTMGGTVEIKRDGRWQPTGIEAVRTEGALEIDLAALSALAGPLDETILNNPTIVERTRTSEIDKALNADSTNARRAVGANSRPGNWQAHHLIPFEVMASMSPEFQRRLVAAGWQMDSLENVLALPGDEATFAAMKGAWPIHRGPHPNYSRDVRMLLASLEATHEMMSDKDLRSAMAAIEGEMGARLRARRYYKYVR